MSNTLVFISSRLGKGGAEKHLLRLVNELASQGFNVQLLLTQKGGEYESHIDDKIKVTFLSERSNSYLVSLLLSIRSLIRFLSENQYTNVIAIQDGPILLGLIVKWLKLKKLQVIGWVQNNPAHLRQSLGTLPYYWGAKYFYGQLELLIALSEGVKSEYLKLSPRLTDKNVVIPNIGYPEATQSDMSTLHQLKTNRINLVACGRLVPQKNYFLMIDALRIAIEKIKTLHLTIIGEGRLLESLQQYAQNNGVASHITFLGFIENPETVIRQGDVFLLTSDFEGFGNVIVEAMASGVPVISTDCPYGPSEIIENGKDGILVPVKSSQEIANKIIELASDPDQCQRLSKASLLKAKQYTAKIITEKFLQKTA